MKEEEVSNLAFRFARIKEIRPNNYHIGMVALYTFALARGNRGMTPQRIYTIDTIVYIVR